MEVGILHKDGSLTNVRTMKQSDLTSGCWLIQMFGISSCETCEVLGTDEYGGKEIRRKKLKEPNYVL